MRPLTNNQIFYRKKLGHKLSIDIQGQRFGKLIVVERMPLDERNNGERCGSRWIVICDCGRKSTAIGRLLRYGQTKSCGCERRLSNSKRTSNLISVGDTFGMLVVSGPSEKTGQGQHWFCICGCGNTSTVRQKELRNGTTKSCGCMKRSALIRSSERAKELLVPGWLPC